MEETFFSQKKLLEFMDLYDLSNFKIENTDVGVIFLCAFDIFAFFRNFWCENFV